MKTETQPQPKPKPNTAKIAKLLGAQWIDINDSFPNCWANRDVIVYMPNAYTCIDVQTVYNDGKDGSRFAEGWNKGEGCYAVTHWMPIPETPKKS